MLNPHWLLCLVKHYASLLEFVVSFEIFFRTKFLSLQRWYGFPTKYWKVFGQIFKLEVAAFIIEYSPRRFLSTLFLATSKGLHKVVLKFIPATLKWKKIWNMRSFSWKNIGKILIDYIFHKPKEIAQKNLHGNRIILWQR